MAEGTKQDLKVVGNSSCAGGQFRQVKITGECDITGDVECERLACTGDATIRGNLQTDELSLTGDIRITGSVGARKVSGTGDMVIDSGICGEEIRFTGNLEVQGDCESGSLEVRGGIYVQGLLSAERLQLRMLGPCQAGEIGGGNLDVKRSKGMIWKNLFAQNSQVILQAELIEGDVLSLDYTKSGVVRGKDVVIGPGCEIERVEYWGKLEVHPEAIVKERIRLNDRV